MSIRARQLRFVSTEGVATYSLVSRSKLQKTVDDCMNVFVTVFYIVGLLDLDPGFDFVPNLFRESDFI